MKYFQRLGRDATDLGGFVRFMFGRRVFLVVTDPEITESLLKTYMEKDDLMNFMRAISGNGSIFAPDFQVGRGHIALGRGTQVPTLNSGFPVCGGKSHLDYKIPFNDFQVGRGHIALGRGTQVPTLNSGFPVCGGKSHLDYKIPFNVSIWRPRRKQIVHAFSPKMLQQFAQVFIQGSEELVYHLREKANTGAFSVWKYLTNYTMDSVCITNLGVNVGAQKSNDSPFCSAFEQAFKILGDRICQPWLHVDSIYRLFPHRKRMLDAVAICDNFINTIICERRSEMEGIPLKEEQKYRIKSERSTLPVKSFMEILMEGVGEGGLDDEALRDECMVIAAAGTDTSAVGACFALTQLARHPDVQEKVFKEVKEIFGDGRSLTREDLGKLPYTDAVVRETLRLYPPVPVIVRRVDRTVTLPSGHTLVPGTGILVHIWMQHRNPKYWGSDAEQYRPERFLNNQQLPHPAAFIPFSHGPRNCLGYQYAMMSMKTALAYIIRRFKVLPPSKSERLMRLKFDIMMKDVDSFPLRLEIRDI